MTQTRFIPVILMLTGLLNGALESAAQEITSEQLLEGLKNPNRWLTYTGDYTGQRHSPLTEITPANVDQLRV